LKYRSRARSWSNSRSALRRRTLLSGRGTAALQDNDSKESG
jgi:hypothetical protein